MKGRFIVLAMLTVFGVLSPAAGASSPEDFALGSQKVVNQYGFQHVRVSAHSGPNGENAHGWVHITYSSSVLPGGTADVTGEVDCLFVINGQANISARLSEPFLGLTHVTLILSDLSNPGDHLPPNDPLSDRAAIGFTSAPPPFTCASIGITLVGDASGNITVNDSK
jgi:hypothetical protein